MKKTIPVLIFCLFFCGNLIAQKVTISGYIKDRESGEELIGATILDKKSKKGTVTNLYGFYSLTLPKDSVNLIFSFVGYQPIKLNLLLEKDVEHNIELSSSLELDEVEIIAAQSERIQEKTEMSTIDLSMQKIQALPVLLGEKDIMKTIQLLPGVQSGSEGSSGIYVRGGGPDQNLILLDGVPIYNASHLFGFFSVFNADAVKSVKLVKGGFPSRYGGRLSSVVDVRMKEGSKKKFSGEGSIGFISSKLTLQGPIVKEKTSFIVSARRTYLDLLTRPFIKLTSGGYRTGGYFFHDFNMKLNHSFSKKSRLFFSSYLGDDKLFVKEKDNYTIDGITYKDKLESALKWGNDLFALRWNYLFSNKLFSNTTLTYSRYQFDVGFNESYEETGVPSEYSGFNYISGINDWSGKIDFDYMPTPNHYVKFGVSETYHTFTPGVNQFKISNDIEEIDTAFGSRKQYAHEFHGYIEDDLKLGARLKANIGLHYSGFLVNKKFYGNFEPRLSCRLLLSEKVSVKGSYGYMAQYLHLLTNPSIGLPTDLWVPVTDKILPQLSHQVALGFASTVKNKYEISVEGYYKTMSNLIDYKEGVSFLGGDEDWQEKVTIGKGWSYGIELLLEKKIGKTSGWLGYTISWTDRQFDELNFGEKFPYKYDRRHDVGAAVTHKFNDKIDIGLVWVYGTGNAVTLGLERYNLVDNLSPFGKVEIQHIESRNNYREPAYHRLDIGVNFHKDKKWGEATWSFGLYNSYNRKNPFYLYFSWDNTNNRVLKQMSIFPLIPSISYAFKF